MRGGGVILLMVLLVAGCTTVHPPADVEGEETPIVVISGWSDPFIGGTHAAKELRKLTGNPNVLAVHPGFAWSFDGAADKVVREVEKAFGEGAEVDVVAISMGGVTLRHAATPGRKGKRLNVRKGFTIAAPHTGAQLANWVGFWGTGLAMRTNSPFLRRLAEREKTHGVDYDFIAYARRNDYTIGAGSALPPHLAKETELMWVDTPVFPGGHFRPYADERILGDIARRLAEE